MSARLPRQLRRRRRGRGPALRADARRGAHLSLILLSVAFGTELADCDGVRVEQRDWKVDGTKGTSWWVRMPRRARMGVEPSTTLGPLHDLAPAHDGPWVAVNGGFYRGGPLGLVVSNGDLQAPLTPDGGSGVLSYREGLIDVVHRDAWKPGSFSAVQSIDRIVDGGASLVKPRAKAKASARTAVAITDDDVWLVVAAARRSVRRKGDVVQLVDTERSGLTLAGLADVLVDAGAVRAINLDGGWSSAMEVRACGLQLSVRGAGDIANAVFVWTDGRNALGSFPADGAYRWSWNPADVVERCTRDLMALDTEGLMDEDVARTQACSNPVVRNTGAGAYIPAGLQVRVLGIWTESPKGVHIELEDGLQLPVKGAAALPFRDRAANRVVALQAIWHPGNYPGESWVEALHFARIE